MSLAPLRNPNDRLAESLSRAYGTLSRVNDAPLLFMAALPHLTEDERDLVNTAWWLSWQRIDALPLRLREHLPALAMKGLVELKRPPAAGPGGAPVAGAGDPTHFRLTLAQPRTGEPS